MAAGHSSNAKANHEREQDPAHLGRGRQCGEWLAGNSLLGLGGADGPCRLGQPLRRPPAWRHRLSGGRDHAAGDLHHRDRAAGARALERSGHHRQAARCRRLWRHLPDGQHPRPMRGLRRRLPLCAPGLSQRRPAAGIALWRCRLCGPGEQDRPDHGHDRDAPGDREIWRRSWRPPVSTPSMSARRTSRSAWATRRDSIPPFRKCSTRF